MSNTATPNIRIVSRSASSRVLFECAPPADLASGMQLRYALEQATIIQANLRGAALREADLREADLSGADLREADLSGADLQGADLSGADLQGADLSGAVLSGAIWRETRLIGEQHYFQVGPMGSRNAYLEAFITERGIYLQTGCFFGTREEFVTQLERTHGDNQYGKEYHAALALIDLRAGPVVVGVPE